MELRAEACEIVPASRAEMMPSIFLSVAERRRVISRICSLALSPDLIL